MLILKEIILFLLLILHKMSYHIFANQFWNQLPYKSCNCSETYVNFESNFWFILLISHKMSLSYFHELVLEPVTVQDLLLCRNLCLFWRKLFDFYSSSYIKLHIIFSRTSSGTSSRTNPVTVSKLMLSLMVIIWFLFLILHKMSYHIFANQIWNQLPYKSCYCVETYVNFDGNYLIFTPNLT